MEIQNEVVSRFVNDLQVTATLPSEMMASQNQLIEWCGKKSQFLQIEADELKQAYEHAKKMKWKYTTLQSQYNKALKRIVYYDKIKAALMAGYTIIPNFTVDIFAIRTDKDKPKKYLSTDRWDNQRSSQFTHDLPLGVGEYKNESPLISSRYIDEKTKQYWAEDWRDEIEFPLNMCKPLIMEATSNAMALKIFDRFGVFPSRRKNDDPVIIGQIIHKRGGYQSDKVVSFMIAWHLNTNVL